MMSVPARNRSARRREQADDLVDQSRLACGVRTEKTEHFPLLDGEADAIVGADAIPVFLNEVFYLEQHRRKLRASEWAAG